MSYAWARRAVVLLCLGTLGGAGTETRAQYSRRTPIVEAVQKTQASIVSVKVEKKVHWGRKESSGTGVIVDERGFVVTNHHVIASADRILVQLSDDSEVAAQILADDPTHDLAVLRLQTTRSLQALPLGPSSDVMVGETVIAVGHPFGYRNTVSTGIVSALDRQITMPTGDVLRDLIQTTASINPGNSGGPLLNINGELIGINVALREGAQGIAFALSSDMVKQTLCKLLSSAKIAGVGHGLQCREAIEATGRQRQQVLVQEVSREGPAAVAGLRQGDKILRVAQHSVSNRFDIERALWNSKAGQKVAVTVLRAGQEMTLPLVLVKSTEEEPFVVSRNRPRTHPSPYRASTQPVRGLPARNR